LHQVRYLTCKRINNLIMELEINNFNGEVEVEVDLIVVTPQMNHVLASSKTGRENFNFNQNEYKVKCHHVEDWGCTLGGVEPCDKHGNSLSLVPTGSFSYYLAK
jgi:hypothetical protein